MCTQNAEKKTWIQIQLVVLVGAARRRARAVASEAKRVRQLPDRLLGIHTKRSQHALDGLNKRAQIEGAVKTDPFIRGHRGWIGTDRRFGPDSFSSRADGVRPSSVRACMHSLHIISSKRRTKKNETKHVVSKSVNVAGFPSSSPTQGGSLSRKTRPTLRLFVFCGNIDFLSPFAIGRMLCFLLPHLSSCSWGHRYRLSQSSLSRLTFYGGNGAQGKQKAFHWRSSRRP